MAATPPKKPDRTVLIVRKHHWLVRWTHWLNVPLLFGLIGSGLAIYWAAPVFKHAPDPVTGSRDYMMDFALLLGRSPNWIYDHLSLGTGQLAGALRIHWFLAYFFMLNGLLYAVGLVQGGGWRALMPRPSDGADALAMIRYYLGVIPHALAKKPWPHPPVRSKYNALQRGAYFTMPLVGALVVLSGWAMHKPSTLPWLERLFVSYDGARIVHFGCMLVLGSFVVPHVILVIADGFDTFRSMVVGWSTRAHDREA